MKKLAWPLEPFLPMGLRIGHPFEQPMEHLAPVIRIVVVELPIGGHLVLRSAADQKGGGGRRRRRSGSGEDGNGWRGRRSRWRRRGRRRNGRRLGQGDACKY